MKRGKPIPTSLEHIVLFPIIASESYSTIVALHGRGTNEYDLVPLVQALGLEDILLIAPRAPLRFNASLGGGYAWYDLRRQWGPNTLTFNPSLVLLRHFLSEIRAGYPVDPRRLILLGFSQGTVMAYAAALSDPASIRGIAALSGYIPTNSGVQQEPWKLNNLSVFISHGTYDQIIPVRLGRESAELLKRTGADVLYREYPMGHEVRPETLRDLATWMSKLLP